MAYKIIKDKKGFIVEESKKRGFGFATGFKTRASARKFISRIKKLKSRRARRPL